MTDGRPAEPELIHHIGILVDDLDAAIERWSRATGYTFSPVSRYLCDDYVDSSDASPHHHEARKVISREGAPFIELLEASGEGTHALSELGIHHLAIKNIADPDTLRATFEAEGIGNDGIGRNADGKTLIWFTDKNALDGIRIEFVSPLPGHVVADDGSPLPPHPVTGRPDVWAGAQEPR